MLSCPLIASKTIQPSVMMMKARRNSGVVRDRFVCNPPTSIASGPRVLQDRLVNHPRRRQRRAHERSEQNYIDAIAGNIPPRWPSDLPVRSNEQTGARSNQPQRGAKCAGYDELFPAPSFHLELAG